MDTGRILWFAIHTILPTSIRYAVTPLPVRNQGYRLD